MKRTAISTAIPGVAVSNKAPLVNFEPSEWLQVFRGIARATDERTVLADNVPQKRCEENSAPGNKPTNNQSQLPSTLVLANLNSLPLDWAARLSVGGVNMNFFIVKQLPVLPPDVYLETAPTGDTWVELIVPRALETDLQPLGDLQPFAQDLGYDGPAPSSGTKSADTASSVSWTPSTPTCTNWTRKT